MEKPKERTSLEDDLRKHIQGLKEENRLKLYYLLDYVLNYKKGWRFLHKTSELNLWNELSTLTQLGIVQKEEERDYRSNKYKVLFIKEENKNFIIALFAGLVRNHVRRANSQQLRVRKAVDVLRRFDVESMKDSMEKIRNVSTRVLSETST